MRSVSVSASGIFLGSAAEASIRANALAGSRAGVASGEGGVSETIVYVEKLPAGASVPPSRFFSMKVGMCMVFGPSGGYQHSA